MAELDIGSHCSIPECKQLDFLPFACDGCSKVFCLEHKGRTAHNCSDVNYEKDAQASNPAPVYGCTFGSCNKCELVPIVCDKCDCRFCLKHRLPEDHDCKSLNQAPLPKVVATPIIFKNETKLAKLPKKKPLNAKNEKLAAKVALMKLKQKSTGDEGIPIEKRAFFSIKASGGQELSIFVSNEWTFGKLLDKVARMTNLTNTNNISLKNRLVLRNCSSHADMNPSTMIADAIKQDLVYSGSTLEICNTNLI